LPGGGKFTDIVSFKDVLMAGHRDQLARCLTEKLLTYSMGRTLEPADDPYVEQIVAALKQRGGGLRDLVVLVAGSEPFRRK